MNTEEIIKLIEELPLTVDEKKWGKNPIGPIVTFLDDEPCYSPWGQNQWYHYLEDIIHIEKNKTMKVTNNYYNVTTKDKIYYNVFNISFCRAIPMF